MAVLFTRRGKIPNCIDLMNYIQSSGTQYINTGFKPTNKTRVVMAYECSNDVSPFGVRSTTNGSGFLYYYGGTTRNVMFGSTYHSIGTNTGAKTTVDFNGEALSVTVNGAANSLSAATFTNTYPLYLFAFGEAATPSLMGSMKLYYCQIYDNGTLIRDFVPCLDRDGVACLYDNVDKKYYYNAGTGEFTAG